MLGFGQYGSGDLASTCKARDYKDATDLVVTAYGFQPRIARNGRGDMGDICHTLNAQAGGTGKGDAAPHVVVLCRDDAMPAMTAGGSTAASKGGPSGQMRDKYIVPEVLCHNPSQPQCWRIYDLDGKAPALQSGEARGNIVVVPGAAYQIMVRRLMPVECERLMGMPDNWTQVPYRGKPAEECADGPRYKAIGNSKAVPAVRWIVRRMKREMEYGDMGL